MSASMPVVRLGKDVYRQGMGDNARKGLGEAEEFQFYPHGLGQPGNGMSELLGEY